MMNNSIPASAQAAKFAFCSEWDVISLHPETMPEDETKPM